MTAINFEHCFDSYVRAHPKHWAHDRSASLGASEVFGCIRRGWFARNDAPRDSDYEDKWGALQRGDLIENHFVEPAIRWAMETNHGNARLVWSGKRQRTFIDGRTSATPDGLVIGADDDALALYGVPSLGDTGCFNFEVKSIDPRVNLKEEKAQHRGQVTMQMGLTRRKTRYRPNYAVIVYIDASFFDQIDVFVVTYDDAIYRSGVQRAETVFSCKNPVELFPEGKVDGTCTYCPFTQICAQTNAKNTPTDGEANANTAELPILIEFEALVRAERAASVAKKDSEAEHKEASERLKQWFRETGVRRAVAADDSIKASLSWIKGRETYDFEAMRADGIDIRKYVKVGEGHDRLSISEKGPTRDES